MAIGSTGDSLEWQFVLKEYTEVQSGGRYSERWLKSENCWVIGMAVK